MMKAMLYYVAAALSLLAAAMNVYVDGFPREERLYVGLLVFMAAVLIWLGQRAGSGVGAPLRQRNQPASR
jgi:hypothetical protein